MDAGRDAILQDRFAFPLAHGQLYTSYDLTWRAHQQKRLVRSAMNNEMTDPFERIGVDPYWEFKVFHLSRSILMIELGFVVEIRIIHGTHYTCPKNRLQSQNSAQTMQSNSTSKGIRILADMVSSSSTAENFLPRYGADNAWIQNVPSRSRTGFYFTDCAA